MKTRRQTPPRRTPPKCRKKRRGVNPLKRGSIFGSYDPWKGTIFAKGFRKAAPAVEDDPGGWKKTLSQMNTKKVIQRISKQIREEKRRDVAEAKKEAAEDRIRGRKWDKEMAAKEKWPLVVAEGKRAEELALDLLKTYARDDKPEFHPAYWIINKVPLKDKMEAARSKWGSSRGMRWDEGSRAGSTAKGFTTIVPEKKMYETILWKDVVETGERLVQSPKRPAWLEGIEKTKRLIKKWKMERAKEEKNRAKKKRKDDAYWKKRMAEGKRLERMTPEQLKRHYERERAEFKRKHPEEFKAAREREAAEKHRRAVQIANRKWVKDIAAQAGKIIKQRTGRAATLEEIARYVNEALKIRGFGGDVVTNHISPEEHESTGAYTGKFRLWSQVGKPMPGAVVPDIAQIKDEDDEEDAK